MKHPKGFRGKYFSLAAILAFSTTVTLANETKSFVDASKESQVQEEYDEKEEVTPSNEELDTVVISKKIKVKESDATFASEIYTQKQIQRSRSKDIYEFLNTQTSITTIPSYGNIFAQSLDMRGYSIGTGYENVVITLNGKHLNNIDMSSQLLFSIPIDSIEKIEVLKGSGSVEYGDGANAGVINIFTKDFDGINLKSYIGSDNLEFVSLGAGVKKEKFSISGYIDDYSHDGYKVIASENTQDKSWSRNKEIKGTLTPVENLTLNLGKSFSKMYINYPNDLTLSQYQADPAQLPTQETNYGITEKAYTSQAYDVDILNYGVEYLFNKNTKFKTQVFKEDKENIFSGIGGTYPYSSLSKYKSTEYNSKINYTKDDWSLLIGHTYSDRSRNSYGNKVSKDTRGYYVSLKYKIDDKQKVSFGSRYASFEYTHDSGFSKLKDKDSLKAFDIGYNYSMDEKSSIFVNFNRSFQLPNIDRFFTYDFSTYQYQFNGFISPMKVNTLNAGYSYLAYPHKLKVATFYSKLKDEIYYNSNLGLYGANTNLDETYKYGFEVYEKYNVKYNLFLALNYSFVKTKVTSDSSNPSVVGREIPGVSKHSAKLSVGYNPTYRVSLILSYAYRSKAYAMSDFDGSYGKMESYSSTDFSASYKYKNYEIFAKVNNLFDRSNALFADSGTALGVYPVNYERSFLVGFKAKF